MDMFSISSFLRYCKKEYPHLDIHVKWNPVGLYMSIQIKNAKSYQWYFGDFSAEDEKDAISKICFCITDFLAKGAKA